MIDAHSRLFTSKLGILVSTNLPTKIFRKVTHCIFDMDGTLLDSELIYHQMIHKLCEKYGKNYSKKMEYKYCGGTDREICVAVVNELKLPISADEMENQLMNISYKMLPHSPLLPGAERLLRHLHDYKVPLALATNSTEQAVRLHVNTKPAFFGMFHHKVSVTDPEVLRGKPHPDLYLLAASRFPEKPKPAKCLVFEDSEKGVLAAREAGMQVVMIPDVRIDREKTRHATLVLRSLLDFKPELFGLPPFDGNKGENKTRPDRNEAPDKTEQLEEKTSKDELKKSMIEEQRRRKSIYENIVQTKSIRLSIIDILVGRTSIQGRTDFNEQPRRISFINKLVRRKGPENGVGKEQRESISISERFANRRDSIPDGPYKRTSISFGERPLANGLVDQYGRRTSILKGLETRRPSVENKDLQKDDVKRQQKSKKEEMAKEVRQKSVNQ